VEAPVDLTRTGNPIPAGAPVQPEGPASPQPTMDGAGLLRVPPSVTTDPAIWGWRGRLRRLTGGLVKPRPGVEEARYRLAEVAVRQHLGGARLVMVGNPKGGSRVSTTALMLAHVFGSLRGGSVVAWDNNESRGTLAERAEIATPNTHVWHLLSAFDRLASTAGSAGDMSHYLRTQPSRADILAADTDPARREQIGSAECGRLGLLLSRFYRLTLVDTGNNTRAGNWQWTAQRADALVVPITLDPDIARAAAWMLDSLVAHGRADLVAGAVTVISPAAVTPPADVRARLLQYFGARTAALVEVPADPQLAGGAPVVFGRISEASRRAWVAAAAAVADRLAAVHSTRPDQMAPPPAPAYPAQSYSAPGYSTPAHSPATYFGPPESGPLGQAPQPMSGPTAVPQPPAADGPGTGTGTGTGTGQDGGHANVTALPVRRAQAQ
jgi:MinD-like ATPase involved in chromosome partitioning or flagellar assembly